jgi:hypothetical protein
LDVAFYLAVGRVKTKGLKVDVRIAGRRCGEITLGGKNNRHFVPKNYEKLWDSDSRTLPWSNAGVRRYLLAAAQKVKQTHNEATVESAFLVELRRSRSTEKLPLLLQQQPVYLGGLPFQFPLPIRGSGTGEPRLSRKSAAGHVDVLARRRGDRLRVFEIKVRRAPETIHALAQSIIYAAALRRLLRDSPKVYLPMLGYSPRHRHPRFEAIALIDDHDYDKVKRSAELLQSANDHFDLYVMCYAFNAQGRLEITREELLGKARR